MSCIYKYKGQKYSEEQFKEYFNNNKQEFTTSIAKNKDVIDSFKRKMEGIDFVFSQSPELASIGSKAQYLQYLSTIFKTSKVKDIVYHYTDANKFDKFIKDYIGSSVQRTGINAADSQLGIFFGNKKLEGVVNKEKLGNTEIPAIINITKENRDIYERADKYLYSSDRFIDEQEPDYDIDIEEDENGNIKTVYKAKEKTIGKDFERQYYNALKNDLITQGVDGIITDNIKIVFEPEQIHILGSKSDIEGFKDFVQGKQFQKLTERVETGRLIRDINQGKFKNKNKEFEKIYREILSLPEEDIIESIKKCLI